MVQGVYEHENISFMATLCLKKAKIKMPGSSIGPAEKIIIIIQIKLI